MTLCHSNAKTYIINDWGYLCFFNKQQKPVHRWVAEKYVIKRRLLSGEVVHHKDGDKLNNQPENLQVFANQIEHTMHHVNNLLNHGDWYKD